MHDVMLGRKLNPSSGIRLVSVLLHGRVLGTRLRHHHILRLRTWAVVAVLRRLRLRCRGVGILCPTHTRVRVLGCS